MRIKSVRCAHGHLVDRDTFQMQLSAANPQWKAFMDELEATDRRPRTNPDGDVSIALLPFRYFHQLFRLHLKA